MDGNAALKKYQDAEAARVRAYAKNAGMAAPEKYASGGGVKAKGGTTINIVVGKDQQQPNPMAAAALASALKPKPAPVTVAPPAPPPQQGQQSAMPPMGAPGLGGIGAGAMMPGMKKGGRATAVPMTAGSMSGPGREQKAASEAKKEGRAARPTPKAKA